MNLAKCRRLFLMALVSGLAALQTAPCSAEVLLARGTSWKYRKGTAEASEPRGDWREADFADAGWSSGQAPVGYGETDVATILTDMQGRYTCIFLRKTFTVASMPPEMRLRASVDYDDGFMLWINGEQVLEKNEPDGEPLYSSLASEDHESGVFEDTELSDPDDYLELGENVVAVQVFNRDPGSSDCKIDVELVSYLRVADTTFSQDRGFYDAAFSVTISTATPGATIRYTTDGSLPTATHGTAGGTNAVVQISTTRCLRAAAFKGGYEPTDCDTQTYIFLDDVIHQPRNPAGFPSMWGGTYQTPVTADYEMDPQVVNDSRYSGTIENDLKTLPSMSVVCDPDDFLGSMGFYSNPTGEWVNASLDWSRACSLELIDPAGLEGFQVDCGIKVAGAGFRNMDLTRKKSMSLVFKSQYGPGKLRYPLFSDSPIEQFDNINLRSGGNDSWALFPTTGQFARDQWGREVQRDMGWMASHGRFMHLYINGLYWGLFNLTERITQNTLAETYGGEKEDYDILTGLFRESPYYQAKDGDTTAFDEVIRLRDTDLSVTANYEAMQQWLDVPQMIDYLIVAIYQPHLDWDYYYSPHWTFNNIRFARKSRNRMPGDMQFQFFIWDIEHSMEINLASTDKSATAGPWAVHQNLTANRDYKVLFGDHVHRHLFNTGVLTRDRAKARYADIAALIDRAVVGESARWGDMPIGPKTGDTLTQWTNYFARTGGGTWTDYHARTRDDEWIPERDRLLNQFLHNRTASVLSQFKVRGLYPSSAAAPSFHQHGGAIAAGFRLTMSVPGYTVYYTTDGTDPRLPGGTRAGGALPYAGPVPLTRTTHVKARVWKTAATWSAANAATFNFTGHHSKIRITEILYNPLGGGDYEFVEIGNTGTSTRGLSEMTFTGIRYTFPPGTELAAGERLVLANNLAAFTNRYPGVAVFGTYRGGLSNGGERLALLDSDGLTVTSVRYNDKAPWPETADGDGFSLTLADPDNASNEADNWRASNLIGGSPGYDDGAPYRVVISEALTHTDLPQLDAIELHNAGTAGVDIGGWYLSDSALAYKKFPIPGGTVLAAGGYVVFDESDFNTDTNNPACFGLDSHGDDIYLTKWDTNGHLQYLADARFGGAPNGVAFARYVRTDGEPDFVEQATPHTLGAANAAPRVGPVVINELMYHPADGEEEFIELVNVSDQTLSLFDANHPSNTWRLGAAVDYAFPQGAALGVRECALLVPTNAAAFRARYGIPAEVQVFGPYTGRLSNGGESVKLYRPDTPDENGVPWILVDRVQYNDNAPWPENADGDGPSLERQDPAAYGNDPVNWAASLNAGGTPGAANSGGLVSRTAGWKYEDNGTDLGTAWRDPSYADAAWRGGNAPLGYADVGLYPDLDTEVDYGDDPNDRHITTYFRKAFTLAADPDSVTNLALYARYDDGFVAYLNGQEVARGSMPGGAVTYATTATSHTATDYELFDLGAHIGKLAQGVNVLAVEVHQSGPGSSDLFIDMELRHAARPPSLNVPAAPSGLSASAVSASRIDLNWTDNSTNEDGFLIDRRQSGASEWLRVATLGSNVTSRADSGLASGTTFYYKAKAYNADGNSDYTAVASATTLQGPPAAPSGLAAAAAGLTRINLSWQDNSGNEDGFAIARQRDGSGTWVQAGAVGADVTTYADSGLEPGTLYTYKVQATNAVGVSAYSAQAAATTPLPAVEFGAGASQGSEAVSPAWLAVTLSAASPQLVTVDYAATGGSATGGGADYSLAAGTLSFTPGQTAQAISLAIQDDDQEEADETVVVTLSNPANAAAGARMAHTYTIQDNDTLFTACNDLAWEAGQLTNRITWYTPTGTPSGLLVDHTTGEPTPVTLTVSGGAGISSWMPAHPNAGTDAHTVFDGAVDCNAFISYGENLVLTFSGLDPSVRYECVLYSNRGEPSYTDRRATATLSDADAFENHSTPGAEFDNIDDPSATVVCGYNTVNGYVARFKHIAPGSDGDMVLTVGDNISKFYANAVMLKAGSGPALPGVAFAGSTSGADEAAGSAAIPVTLTGSATNTATVNYAVTGGTATGGADYSLSAGTLTFAPGQTSRNITLALIDDGEEESDETVVLTLSSPVNAVLGAGSIHTCTITDDDAPVPADVYTAFNDLGWLAGQLALNITTNSTGSVPLVDYATGAAAGPTLTIGGAGGVASWTPTNLTAGTDAYACFNGKVDCDGFISTAADPIALTFSGLATNLGYELVVYGNRAGGYLDRLATVTISDVAAFENQSSAGATFAGPTDPAVTICNGENTANGYVARFAGVACGADGDIVLTLSLAGGSTAYFNAVMLRAYNPAGRNVKIAQGATWRYRKGTAEATAPPAAWRLPPFDDSGWASGTAPLGYGASGCATVLTDMQYSYTSFFMRRAFQIGSPALVQDLRLWARYDDAFVVWVNGEEVARVNAPGAPGTFLPFDTLASVSTNDAQWSAVLAGDALPALRPGTNVVAAQLFNAQADSSDAVLELELSAAEGSLAANDGDGDGMPDDWEHAQLGGTGQSTEGDADNDSLSNMDEFVAGTDPDSAAAVFRVELSAADGQLVVSFPTLAASGTGYDGLSRRYTLERRLGLSESAVWTAVPGYAGIPGAGQTVSYTNTAGDAVQIYRAKVWLIRE
ncbi:MAG: lamin tail domain-containing protein [Kiritimatiellae bacterium]|nr:lamin tail domain-containing protein [Kiritimatiellia bacterium]